MAEPQLFESVSVAGTPTLVDGAEVTTQDTALVGKVSGLADDRVLSELLRLMPTDGTSPATRTILPAGYGWYTQQYNPLTDTIRRNVYATVAPTGSANGSVQINPFRAIIGTRTPAATLALDNWRDTRSAVFVGGATALAQVVALSANASGNPRWDLVYAAVTVDAQSNSVQRRVKDPSSSAVSVQPIYQYLATSVSIQVRAGTPGATPAIPNVPADSGNVYNIALAAVLVQNGFGSTTTVLPEMIREVAPVMSLSPTAGGVGIRPANQQHDRINADGTITPGTYKGPGSDFAWATTTPFRPSIFLPPSMVGGEQRLILMDFKTSGHHSHANADLLDDSVDWRNRFFKGMAFVCANELFATDPSAFASPNPSIPFPLQLQDGRVSMIFGNSFVADSALVTNYASLYLDTDTVTDGFSFQSSNPIATGTKVGLLCSPNSGTLHAYVLGDPGCRVLIWLEASGQMPNNVTASP